MDFITVVFRKSKDYWVALCLENGLVGQGFTKEDAINKLRESIGSFEEAVKNEKDIYCSPIPIKELHEFMTVEETEPITVSYELRAVYA
jgi:predicted RNase H-like HicB family nuclease